MSTVQVVVALSLLSLTFLIMFGVTYFNPPSAPKEVQTELLEPVETDDESDSDENSN